MKITYKSAKYSPSQKYHRYVRNIAGMYRYIETFNGFDYLQATLDASEVPEGLRRQADEMAGQHYGWIHWPDNVPRPCLP